jgi:hypothetical protein
MLDGIPAALRQGRSDIELARELGVRAWAIEFTGGPLNCWLEVEETGQHTTEARLPGPQGIFWTCPPERGRILFWFRPGASRENGSGRSRRILKQLPERTDPIAEVIVLSGAASSKEWSANPRLARWWSNWNDVSIKEIARAGKVEGANEVTLFAIEATEKGPPAGAVPRKVKLALKAQAAPHKNP